MLYYIYIIISAFQMKYKCFDWQQSQGGATSTPDFAHRYMTRNTHETWWKVDKETKNDETKQLFFNKKKTTFLEIFIKTLSLKG